MAITTDAIATQVATRPALRRVMRATEYFTLAFGSIVGVGWLVVINTWLARGGPVGAMLGFLAGGLLLVPIVLVYGRLARQMPESASEIAYTAAVFPPSVSFATGWIMTFAYMIICPFEAVAIGQLAGYVFPGLNAIPLYRLGEGEAGTVYLPHLILGIGLTGLIGHIPVFIYDDQKVRWQANESRKLAKYMRWMLSEFKRRYAPAYRQVLAARLEPRRSPQPSTTR